MARRETRHGPAWRSRARATSVFRDGAIDFCDPCFFPELGLERATTVIRRTL